MIWIPNRFILFNCARFACRFHLIHTHTHTVWQRYRLRKYMACVCSSELFYGEQTKYFILIEKLEYKSKKTRCNGVLFFAENDLNGFCTMIKWCDHYMVWWRRAACEYRHTHKCRWQRIFGERLYKHSKVSVICRRYGDPKSRSLSNAVGVASSLSSLFYSFHIFFFCCCSILWTMSHGIWARLITLFNQNYEADNTTPKYIYSKNCKLN